MALRVVFRGDPARVPVWAGALRAALDASADVEVVGFFAVARPAAPDALARADARLFGQALTASRASVLPGLPDAQRGDVVVDLDGVLGDPPAGVDEVWGFGHPSEPRPLTPADWRAAVVAAPGPRASVLWAAGSGRGPRALAAVVSASDRRSSGRAASAAHARWAEVVARELRRRARGATPPPVAALPPWPRAVGPTAAAIRLAARFAADKVRHRRVHEQWQLRFTFDEAVTDPAKMHPIAPPADRFWADPFPWVSEGRALVFAEELVYSTGRGTIVVFEVHPDGTWERVGTALDLDVHLSYPQILEVDGVRYLVPETGDAREVVAWRCVAWPLGWTRAAVLLSDVAAYDATLWPDGDTWHMLATVGSGASTVDALHAYSARSFLGPYRPSPANPVCADVRVARNAGWVRVGPDGTERVAQDCAARYGGAVVRRRVLRLDDDGLVEQTLGRIDPAAPDVGVHTLNRHGGLTVADVITARRR